VTQGDKNLKFRNLLLRELKIRKVFLKVLKLIQICGVALDRKLSFT